MGRKANSIQLSVLSCSVLCFALLGLPVGHMEVPRLGVKLELQLPAYATAIAMPDPQPTELGQELNLHPHVY